MSAIIRAPSATRSIAAVGVPEAACAIAPVASLVAHGALTVLLLLAAESTKTAVATLAWEAWISAEAGLVALRRRQARLGCTACTVRRRSWTSSWLTERWRWTALTIGEWLQSVLGTSHALLTVSALSKA